MIARRLAEKEAVASHEVVYSCEVHAVGFEDGEDVVAAASSV